MQKQTVLKAEYQAWRNGFDQQGWYGMFVAVGYGV